MLATPRSNSVADGVHGKLNNIKYLDLIKLKLKLTIIQEEVNKGSSNTEKKCLKRRPISICKAGHVLYMVVQMYTHTLYNYCTNAVFSSKINVHIGFKFKSNKSLDFGFLCNKNRKNMLCIYAAKIKIYASKNFLCI